jgi:hypothetical protein
MSLSSESSFCLDATCFNLQLSLSIGFQFRLRSQCYRQFFDLLQASLCLRAGYRGHTSLFIWTSFVKARREWVQQFRNSLTLYQRDERRYRSQHTYLWNINQYLAEQHLADKYLVDKHLSNQHLSSRYHLISISKVLPRIRSRPHQAKCRRKSPSRCC